MLVAAAPGGAAPHVSVRYDGGLRAAAFGAARLREALGRAGAEPDVAPLAAQLLGEEHAGAFDVAVGTAAPAAGLARLEGSPQPGAEGGEAEGGFAIELLAGVTPVPRRLLLPWRE